MKFLIDRCAGSKLAAWLRSRGHDVIESRSLGPDPGDGQILEWAWRQKRVLVTIDTDFGTLVYRAGASHSGIVRLPDVPASKRIQLMGALLNRYHEDLDAAAIITIRGERARVTRPQ